MNIEQMICPYGLNKFEKCWIWVVIFGQKSPSMARLTLNLATRRVEDLRSPTPWQI